MYKVLISQQVLIVTTILVKKLATIIVSAVHTKVTKMAKVTPGPTIKLASERKAKME